MCATVSTGSGHSVSGRHPVCDGSSDVPDARLRTHDHRTITATRRLSVCYETECSSARRVASRTASTSPRAQVRSTAAAVGVPMAGLVLQRRDRAGVEAS